MQATLGIDVTLQLEELSFTGLGMKVLYSNQYRMLEV